jgi:hypothetical protein
MDQDPEHLADEAAAQTSRWLYAYAARSRVRPRAAYALVIVLGALAEVGLLALTSAFFPQQGGVGAIVSQCSRLSIAGPAEAETTLEILHARPEQPR